MTNRTESHSGVSASFAICVALILLLAISALVALNRVGDTSLATRSANAPSPAPRANEINQAEAAESDAPQPYLLEIKEWGVVVPLPESVKDAYYTTAGGGVGADGLANTVWISQVSFNSNGCDIAKTGPTEVAKPVGAILRVLPTDLDPVKEVPYKELYPDGVMIDSYYYTYKSWGNAKCASRESLEASALAFRMAVHNATKSPVIR